MNCPKCKTESMIQETFEEIEIDKCPACRGIYLDSGELNRLVAAKMGNKADTLGFSSTSDHMDRIEAHCFRCGTDMVKMVGPGEIRVERCPKCKGIFLDQGELASLQLYKS